jgi:hypothetical protein
MRLPILKLLVKLKVTKVKKEEFPTFLNEQPTIMFGRTGRELLVIAVGLSLAYSGWSSLDGSDPTSMVLRIAIAILPVAFSAAIAFVSIAGRPLEEWVLVLAMYMAIPKVFLYSPFEEDEEVASSRKATGKRKFLFNLASTTDEEDD